MRTLFLTMACLLAGLQVQAQTYSTEVKGDAKEGLLHIITANSKIEITAYKGKELVIEAQNYESPETDGRAKGLKPLYNTAEDNTKIGLQVSQEGNVVKIMKASRQDAEYYIKVPQQMNVKIEEANWSGDDMKISGMKGEIEVTSKSSDIVMEEISGPVVASSTSGDITLVFSDLNQDKPTSIAAVSGFVDITLPASAKSKLKLRSISGEIYSDMELEYEEAKAGTNLKRMGGGNTIEANTNGGGVELTVKAISDNIYLRKK